MISLMVANTELVKSVHESLYRICNGELCVAEVEAWVYEQTELEALLNSDDYLHLLAIDYRAPEALDAATAVLMQYIDVGAFHTRRVIGHLKLVLSGRREPAALREAVYAFYDDYCHGYDFLKDLALGFGLRVAVPDVDFVKLEG